MGFSPARFEQGATFSPTTCRDLLDPGSFQLPLGCGSWMDLFPPALPSLSSLRYAGGRQVSSKLSALGCSQNSLFFFIIWSHPSECSVLLSSPAPHSSAPTESSWSLGLFFKWKWSFLKPWKEIPQVANPMDLLLVHSRSCKLLWLLEKGIVQRWLQRAKCFWKGLKSH